MLAQMLLHIKYQFKNLTMESTYLRGYQIDTLFLSTSIKDALSTL